MKRSVRIFSLILVLIAVLSFAGCGSGKSSSSPAAGQAAYDAGAYMTNSAYDSYDYEYAAEAPMAAAESATTSSAGGFSNRSGDVPTAENMSEKIIYNADVTLETTEFDDVLDRIGALVGELGGYMESTSVSGSNYSAISRGNSGVRSAYYTIRIPSAHFNELTGTLSDLGNVPYCRTYSQNVTQQYYDIQSRLEAYRTQEKRLLEMLSIAETVEDMLSIQRELTEVQYELDSLTGTLRYYDNQVNYSTVSLTVQEVREYTPEPTVKLTYWERMSRQFRQSLKTTGEFFSDLFLWFVTSLPWLVPLAAVIVLAISLIRRRVRRSPERAQRREARKAARAERKAARKAKKAPAVTEEKKEE